MGRYKTPSEGGTGGQRGHSNMKHRAYSHELKEATRRGRRIEAVNEIEEQLYAAADRTAPPRMRQRVGRG